MRKRPQETLTIPLHQNLDLGTVRAIFKQAIRFISESQLREHFYVD